MYSSGDQRGAADWSLLFVKGEFHMSNAVGTAYLDEGMRGWIVNAARREFWRVQELCDLADLVQDGYLCFAKCARAYPELSLVTTPSKDQRRQFQALVKTAFANHVSTLAVKHKGVSVRAVSQISVDPASATDAVWDKIAPPQQEEATLLTLLASAPAEIAQLAQLLAADGLDVLRFKRTRTRRRALRETTNEYFCRLLGLDPAHHDLRAKVKAYFGG
jgi:hypothetical protein